MDAAVPQLPPQQVQKALQGDKPPYLLDVRNPNELQVDGRVEGAVNIPLFELQQRAGELPQGRDIVCLCKSGMRSQNAAAWLRQRGLPASNVSGGLMAWLAAGLPVKR
jgi:rhodanese-related sulfurtransferase